MVRIVVFEVQCESHPRIHQPMAVRPESHRPETSPPLARAHSPGRTQSWRRRAAQDGWLAARDRRELCAASLEYSCNRSRCPLCNDCTRGDFGRTLGANIGDMGERNATNGTYFEVLQPTSVAPWNAAMSGSGQRGVFTFSPASGPRTMVACGQNTVTLSAHQKKEIAGVEVAHLEII